MRPYFQILVIFLRHLIFPTRFLFQEANAAIAITLNMRALNIMTKNNILSFIMR